MIIILSVLIHIARAYAEQKLTLKSTGDTILTELSFRYWHQVNEAPYLPYFAIHNILESTNHLKLTMAYRKLPSALEESYPKQGIKIISRSPIRNVQKLFYALNGMLTISRRSINKYQMQFRYSNQSYVYYSDPNDELCTQNIQDLIRMMPCQTEFGVLSIINTRTLFKNWYVGIEFQIQAINSKIQYTIKIYIQNNPKDYFSNLMNTRLQKCPTYDLSTVITGIDNNYVLTKKSKLILDYSKILTTNFPDILIEQHRYISGRWYGFNGTLTHNITIRKDYQHYIVYEHMQKFFYPIRERIRVSTNSSYEIEFSQRQGYNILQFIFEKGNSQNILIQIPYVKLMGSFQQYQSIGRAGQEWMPSMSILTLQNTQQKIYFSYNVIDRIPEPDFSMPFHVITFTMALAGYMWISLWRGVFRIFQYEKKQKCKQEKHSQMLDKKYD